jgi:hypothetical protein
VHNLPGGLTTEPRPPERLTATTRLERNDSRVMVDAGLGAILLSIYLDIIAFIHHSYYAISTSLDHVLPEYFGKDLPMYNLSNCYIAQFVRQREYSPSSDDISNGLFSTEHTNLRLL